MKPLTEDAEHKLIRERAAEWVCELQDGTPARHAEFAAWVRQSPRHIEEFLFSVTAWRALDAIGPADDGRIEQAIADALALAERTGDNIVALPNEPAAGPPAASEQAQHAAQVSRRWLAAAGLAAFGLMTAFGWWGVAVFGAGPTHATAAGEQQRVQLADGSMMYLNTETRARVRFSEHERSVELTEGEALFYVAKDASRPFRVTAGDAVIQAVGTEFNVRRRSENTTVSVIEGRVEVAKKKPLFDLTFGRDTVRQRGTHGTGSEPSLSRHVQVLAAGEEVTVGDAPLAKYDMQDAADAVAWRERRLVFRGETLEGIARELNRYSPSRPLRVEGAVATNKRFAGTFSADDPEALIRFLEQYEELSILATDSEIVIRSSPPQ